MIRRIVHRSSHHILATSCELFVNFLRTCEFLVNFFANHVNFSGVEALRLTLKEYPFTIKLRLLFYCVCGLCELRTCELFTQGKE